MVRSALYFIIRGVIIMNKTKNNPIWNIYCHRYTASNGISFCWFGSRQGFSSYAYTGSAVRICVGPGIWPGVGVITPLLSSILTGMPPLVTPVPMAVIMILN